MLSLEAQARGIIHMFVPEVVWSFSNARLRHLPMSQLTVNTDECEQEKLPEGQEFRVKNLQTLLSTVAEKLQHRCQISSICLDGGGGRRGGRQSKPSLACQEFLCEVQKRSKNFANSCHFGQPQIFQGYCLWSLLNGITFSLEKNPLRQSPYCGQQFRFWFQ